MKQPRVASAASVRIAVGEERGPAEVRFDLGERADSIAAVRLDLVHALGVTSAIVPPDAADVMIDLRALPAGPAELRVTPILANGRERRGAITVFSVPGRAGAGPEIATLAARDHRVQRPRKGSTAIPRLRLAYRVPGAAASAIHLELTGPDGSVAYEHLPAPADGRAEIRPFALPAGSPAGTYAVRAAMVDVDGNAGAAATTRFEVGDGGSEAPSIARVTWRKDDRIVVRGAGFGGAGLTALLDGAPAPIAEVADDRLVLVATNSVPARLEVRTAHGAAVASSAVGPPPAIEILPAEPTVAEGGGAQLFAAVRGVAGADVEWSADEAPAVAISADGVVTAGHGAPAVVVVRARIAGTSVTATAQVSVTAPQGRGVTIGARGGTSTGAGGATLTVPAGALAEPVQMRVEAKRSRLEQRGIVVAAELAMTPADLAVPATLEVPLRVHVEPGSTVDVVHRIGDEWVPAGHGTVDASGFTAHLDLSAIPGGIRVLTPWPKHHGFQTLSAAPTINGVNETPVEEGDTVPLLVTGSNFVPGRTQVAVVRNGTVDARIETRGVVVRQDGSALGVTIAIGPLSDLAEGVLSDHVLRVDTAAGRAEFPLPIFGHNELIVTAGQTSLVTVPQRLSQLRVDAGGTLRVASTVPPLTIDVLGDVVIEGTVTVLAAAGATGARGINGGGGGVGGAGASPFGVAPGGAGGAGGSNGNTSGAAGAAGSAPPSAMPGVGGGSAGAGGTGGTAGGGGFWPHLGGDGAKGRTAPNPRIPGFQARSSIAPSPGIGAGGGGGGGGGGEGWAWTYAGGGGGGGGAGGGGVVIAAGATMRLNGAIVTANGGDAGHGGTAGGGPPTVWTYISAGQGGGGGGGAGGTILLQGINDSSGATVLAVSGKPGATPSATTQVEPRTELQQAIARDPSGDIRADGAIIGLVKPVATQGPDLVSVRELVTTQNAIELTGLNATHMRVTSGFGSTRRAITSQSAGLAATTVCKSTLPLAEGFNRVIAEWMYDTLGLPETSPALDAQVLMRSAAVRTRKILFIDHTLTNYTFSATLTPATVSVATERSTDLAVAVTASQPTPLNWSVMGGADYGTVTPQVGGARYRAPSRPLAGPAHVIVASAFAPNLTAVADVTVVAGVATSAVAATGNAATATLPSANCGQVITIEIPPAAYALTSQGFSSVPAVEFPRLFTQAGVCARDVLPVAPVIAPGLLSLTAEVPACADPGGWVHVPGHGSLRLQIVPLITSLAGDRAANPDYTINGSGFACGDTQVLVDGMIQPATSILSLSCGTIHMAQWPNHGASLSVRTSGGDSAPFMVP